MINNSIIADDVSEDRLDLLEGIRDGYHDIHRNIESLQTTLKIQEQRLINFDAEEQDLSERMARSATKSTRELLGEYEQRAVNKESEYLDAMFKWHDGLDQIREWYDVPIVRGMTSGGDQSIVILYQPNLRGERTVASDPGAASLILNGVIGMANVQKTYRRDGLVGFLRGDTEVLTGVPVKLAHYEAPQ